MAPRRRETATRGEALSDVLGLIERGSRQVFFKPVGSGLLLALQSGPRADLIHKTLRFKHHPGVRRTTPLIQHVVQNPGAGQCCSRIQEEIRGEEHEGGRIQW